MNTAAVESLYAVMCRISDPRKRRGVRHPFAGILSLTLIALICRIGDFASLGRWANLHWADLRGPLGFDRPKAPHPTTFSRVLAKFSPSEFQQAFSAWVGSLMGNEDLVAAVDGKTSKQGLDSEGKPIQMLNVFVHDLKACLGQWPLNGDKTTEPEILKAHLQELFATYPGLRLLTGDALYAQRNLADLIVQAEKDYLFQIKGNQPDLLDTAQTCFADAASKPPAAETVEKRGETSRRVGSGLIWTMRIMLGSG